MHTSDGNRRFDAALRARDPHWGLRDVEALLEAARHVGLGAAEIVDMPANNLTVICRRRP